MGNEVIGMLVFGFITLVCARTLYSQGKINNYFHMGWYVIGIILLGSGLVFALPVWFPILNFESIF